MKREKLFRYLKCNHSRRIFSNLHISKRLFTAKGTSLILTLRNKCTEPPQSYAVMTRIERYNDPFRKRKRKKKILSLIGLVLQKTCTRKETSELYVVLIFIFKLLLFKRFIRKFLQFRSKFMQHILNDYFVSSESGGKVLYHEKSVQ